MKFVMMPLMVLLAPMTLGGVIYVDADATGTNDGGSWENALVHLQDALAVAVEGDEIKVAQGVYKPDQGVGVTAGDRNATFQLVNGVALKGGYAGFGAVNPDTRFIQIFQTTLSGDLANNDADVDISVMLTEPTRSENSLHVVTGSGTDATAVLDGFTITVGHAPGVSDWIWGEEDQELPFYDETYSWNQHDLYGAGMINDSGSPTVRGCTFVNNAATYGAGMFNYNNSSPAVSNCIFNRNVVAQWGGGMENVRGSCPTINDCTFSENVATSI